MKLATVALFSFSLALMAGCSSPSTETKEEKLTSSVENQARYSDKLPDFSVTDLEGNVVNISSFKGKKVFVNLWATWCPPCRREIPSIEKLYSKANKQNAVFLLISLDDNFEVARKYAEKTGMKVPIFYPAENLPALFNVDGIPTSFIFNEKGELTRIVNGSDDFDSKEYLKIFGS